MQTDPHSRRIPASRAIFASSSVISPSPSPVPPTLARDLQATGSAPYKQGVSSLDRQRNGGVGVPAAVLPTRERGARSKRPVSTPGRPAKFRIGPASAPSAPGGGPPPHAVQRPVLERLGDGRGRDPIASLQVRDRPGEPEDPDVGARAQPEPRDRRTEQLLAGRVHPAVAPQ